LFSTGMDGQPLINLPSLAQELPIEYHVLMIVAKKNRCLIVGTCPIAYLLDIDNGSLICTLKGGHPDDAWILSGDLFISPDENPMTSICVTIGMQGGEIVIYNHLGTMLFTLVNDFSVSCASMSGDGARLICANAEGNCRLWSLSTQTYWNLSDIDTLQSSSAFKTLSYDGTLCVSEVRNSTTMQHSIVIWQIPMMQQQQQESKPTIYRDIHLEDNFAAYGGTAFLRVSRDSSRIFIWTADFDGLENMEDDQMPVDSRFRLYNVQENQVISDFYIRDIDLCCADTSPTLQYIIFGERQTRRLFLYDMLHGGQQLLIVENPFLHAPIGYQINQLADVAFFNSKPQDHAIVCSSYGQVKVWDLQWERETIARKELQSFLPKFIEQSRQTLFTVELLSKIVNYLTKSPVILTEETLQSKYLFRTLTEEDKY
jgi:WD40 repeat protein